MDSLIKVIKNIETDFIKIESRDRQYIALKDLYSNFLDKDFYLCLILANSLICYQLSSSGEEYWEEFSGYFSENNISSKDEILPRLKAFMLSSKWNKRLQNIKLKRLDKLKIVLDIIIKNEYLYYKDMNKLLNILSDTMKQKKDAKTIVFAIKMFGYGGRVRFDELVYFPTQIMIPVDSRLQNIYNKYNLDRDLKIMDFYKKIWDSLNIPLLHLDSILWVNYNEIINNN